MTRDEALQVVTSAITDAKNNKCRIPTSEYSIPRPFTVSIEDCEVGDAEYIRRNLSPDVLDFSIFSNHEKGSLTIVFRISV